MAQAELSPGIESLRGKLAGYSGFQARFKKWKDDSGRVIKVGPQEIFKRRSRDYKQSPRTEAESAQVLSYGKDGMHSLKAEAIRF